MRTYIICKSVLFTNTNGCYLLSGAITPLDATATARLAELKVSWLNESCEWIGVLVELQPLSLHASGATYDARPSPITQEPRVPVIFPALSPTVTAIVLLTASNVFMTFAWYGHLKYKSSPLILAIMVSWGIAFFEYFLQVPANRIGSAAMSTAQLKILQEVITLVVFAVFSVSFLGEAVRWNYAAAAVCIVAAMGFIFLG